MIDSIGIFFGVILSRIIGWTGRKTIFRPFSNDYINRKKREQKQADFESQSGYQASGYGPNGYPQNGYPPNGYPQNGYAPNGYPQNGYPPNGYPQNGYAPNGYQQNVYVQSPYPQQPYYQNGNVQKQMQYGNPPGRYPSQADDDYVSDRLSEDMSFRKLMQDIKEQTAEAHREHQLQREHPTAKQARKKAPRAAAPPKAVEIDEVDLDKEEGGEEDDDR